MASLTDLHSMREIPAIAHFCSLFKNAFDLIDFEIDDLENALLKENPDDIFSCTLVERLVVRLLIGCLPMYGSKIHDGNFSTYLKQLIQTQQEDAEEEGLEFPFDNPFEDSEAEEFSDLSTEDQVKVVYMLTEFRLLADDVEKKLKDLEPDGLRLNPIGIDSNNVTYWYFYGTRLYKEVKGKRKKPSKKKDDSEDSKKKSSKKKAESEEESDEGSEEPAGWYLACSALSQWEELASKLKKSKKKADKELLETINENFLPEISKMFGEKEREEKIKLLMANKRTSSRIERNRNQKELEFQKRKEEEERTREILKREAEAREKQIEKENKEKNSRSNRMKNREQKQIYARIISDHDYLLTSSKRSRPDGDSNAVDSDHDEQTEEEADESEAKIRRKNPALREFQRLSSTDENSETHLGRNLRL